MALGYRKKKVVVKNSVPKEVAEERLNIKMKKLANAVKVPGSINQFRLLMDETDENRVLELFKKYKPENRKEKTMRIKNQKKMVDEMSYEEKLKILKDKTDKDFKNVKSHYAQTILKYSTSPKPLLTKFGTKHVVSLIEQKKPKLVLIAADVEPISVTVALPTLCKRMDVPYAIVSSQQKLGELVNMKRTVSVAIEDVKAEDAKEFDEIVCLCNAMFADKYDEVFNRYGGECVQQNLLEKK